MPVQFSCPHCSQLLAVARRKVGQPVQCVQCGGGVIVPPPSDFATPLNTPALDDVDQTVDSGLHEPYQPSPINTPIDGFDHPGISVSRSTLYSIGGLLVGVALVSFLLGWAMGRETTLSSPRAAGQKQHRIYGRMTFQTERGETWPDAESVVIAVPLAQRPADKIPITALRPDQPPPDAQHPSVQAIRKLGGDFQRTNHTGDYELTVPAVGEYFVLMISAHSPRSANEPPTTKEIVELSNYFKQPDALLGKNDFQWVRELVRTDLNSDFMFRNR